MHGDKQDAQARRSLTRYPVIGGLLVLALEYGRWAAPACFNTEQQQVAVVGVMWLAIACECAVAFWIGRETDPRWYLGLAAIVGRLPVFASEMIALHRLAATGLVGTAADIRVSSISYVQVFLAVGGALALSAFLGGTLNQGRRMVAERTADLHKQGWQRSRPFAYHAILGGLVALMLVGAQWAVRSFITHTENAQLQAATRSSAPFVSHKETYWLILTLATLFVFLGQCAVAFWVGRKTAPQWYWGLSPIAANVLWFAFFSLPSFLAVPVNGPPLIVPFLMDMGRVRMMIMPEIMALAAILGSQSSRRKRSSLQ
jgi:hypothetical protein